MKSILLALLHGFTAAVCLTAAANAQSFEASSPQIVSAWKSNGENLVLVFRYDGSYYLIQGDPADPGMERGTFSWDNETGAFSADTIVDTNGEGGLSHPNGATTLSITGNTLSYTAANEGGPAIFTRVVNTASAIVGTWTTPGENFSITFLADNTYYHAQVANDVPFGYTGMERGTYTWNLTTKAFTATAAIDTNGDVGVDGTTGVTVNVTGNTLEVIDGLEIFTLTRITTNPTPLRLPDFGTVRYAEYFQTSNSAPALNPFNEDQESYPYSAEVFVDFVGATAPTLKIGAGAPISLDADSEDPSDFYIEQGYATLAELNTILPASTAIQFKNGASIANLTTGASLTFPSIPKINVGEGASWSGGVYRFGDNEVLQWALPAGFVASQYLTVLNVYDPVTDNDVVEAELHGDVTFLDLGGRLEPGKQYGVDLEFYRIDTSTTAGTGVFAGKQGYTLSASTTFFRVRSRNVFPQAPSIFEQPVSQTGTTGSPLLLTVGINEEAFPTATFQWFKNNQAIPGQTGNSLYFPDFDIENNSGRYRVEATNAEGSAVSNIANIGAVGTETQSVRTLGISKVRQHTQQSATVVVPSGFSFDAYVDGNGLTDTFPSSTITLTKPDNTTVPFVFDEDDWDVEQDFTSIAALQNNFPDGLYHVNVGSGSFPIDMNRNDYANIPLLTPSAGTWVDGKLRITASQAAAGFSITSNVSSGNGWLLFDLEDSSDNEILSLTVMRDDPSDPNFISATVPPTLLAVGQNYVVESSFDQAFDYNPLSDEVWAAPLPEVTDSIGRLVMETNFTIEVVPDPVGTPYTTWQAGFFTPTQLANPAISGDEVDFDNDGIGNLLEFVLGGSPTSKNATLLKNATTTPAASGRNLVFFYDRKTAANAITQVIETSSTLTGIWTPAVHGVNGVVIATSTLDANTQRITATIPSTETMLFVRLKASR